MGLMAQSFLLASAACAQSVDADRLKALEQKFNQSLGLIEQLQKRIAELEQRQPATKASAPAINVATPSSSPAPINTRVDKLETAVASLTNSLSQSSTDTGLPLHGFMDVGYARASNHVPCLSGLPDQPSFAAGGLQRFG